MNKTYLYHTYLYESAFGIRFGIHKRKSGKRSEKGDGTNSNRMHIINPLRTLWNTWACSCYQIDRVTRLKLPFLTRAGSMFEQQYDLHKENNDY